MDGIYIVEAAAIPLWIKIAQTLFVGLLVPIYWRRYGPANFLWFSDIALFVTAIALWREDALLASMMAVGVLVPELVWNVGFFGRLLIGVPRDGLANYMFEAERPLWLRAISLFHIVLPFLLLWMLGRLGYDERAWMAQSLLALIILPATYFLTDPEKNINWVFGPGVKPQRKIPSLPYLVLLMAAFPLLVYLPTHLVLSAFFNDP